ncbi:MAG: DUF2155 domain-containing protein [Qingshengfaniella sp.]
MKGAVAGLALALTVGSASAVDVALGTGAELRGLDRLTGALSVIDLPVGSSASLGSLRISLVECRYPTDNPAGDAYAYMLIDSQDTGTKQFEGWMIASSPALNALDHMRYDVWVIRCNRA